MSTAKQSSQPLPAPSSSSSKGEDGATFAIHLEHASSLVQSWPEWKQQVLGGIHVLSETTGTDKR